MQKQDIENMTMVEVARRLAELGQPDKALEAYTTALKQKNIIPEEQLEAACAVLQYGEDYKLAYDALLAVYKEGTFRADAFEILTGAFYAPNQKSIRETYEKNCRLLKKYPYLFRKDFLPFEELPVKFYPYDNKGVLPFHPKEERFDAYTNLNDPEIRHYFFRDLEKPILAHDIVSQYELEYLRDNVRRSDWVGKENHVYLHYSDWGTFCAYLQVWDMKPLLREEKLVFLIEDEIAQYPIDFKERFGIDYSQYPVKPIGIREVNKIIWHTQLLFHNGGDFFNEIMDRHPNLLVEDSVFFKETLDIFHMLLNCANLIAKSKGKEQWGEDSFNLFEESVLLELSSLKNRTLKDAMVAYYLGKTYITKHFDKNSRIAPAIVYQPHFSNMKFMWDLHESGQIIPHCSANDDIRNSGLFQQFKYIKAFTPMRRSTNSHAAAVAFMQKQVDLGHRFSWEESTGNKEDQLVIVEDTFFDRIMNRSYMADDHDRLLRDSRLVRFEDAKLNPTATFTALAEFLDIPYTESMTYGSDMKGIIKDSFRTNAVYNTREEFSDEYERCLMEYLQRDVYECYGYGFDYYDGKPMTQEEIEELLGKCHTQEDLVEASWWKNREKLKLRLEMDDEELDEWIEKAANANVSAHKESRLLAIRVLRHGLNFCNENGEPLRLMTPLKLDPELLERPLYH